MHSTIKILVGYHKPSAILKNDIFFPIHLGRAAMGEAGKDGTLSAQEKQWMLENMPGDDTGENISALNREYCEMTGIYWAWKNYDSALGSPGYIGFSHYRRGLLFMPNSENLREISLPHTLCYEERYAGDDSFWNELKKWDAIIPCFLRRTDETVREHCIRWHGIQTVELMESCIRKNRSEYNAATKKYLNGKTFYWWNSFVFQKEIFFDYCNFIFEILAAIRTQLNITHASLREQRTLGMLAERLTGVYITKLQMERRYCLRYVGSAFFNNTSLPQEIQPAFAEHNVPVLYAVNDAYAPYISVALHSLIKHASPQNNYDIIILEKRVSDANKRKIAHMAAGHANISIRFYSVAALTAGKRFFTHGHFSEEIYYRLYAPSLLSAYDKIVYLDCDTLLQADVAELYHIDIGDNWIGATLDYGIMAKTKSGRYESEAYFQQTLGLHDLYEEYVCSGVLLMNLQELRRHHVEPQLLDEATRTHHKYPDQDILNKICRGHIYHLDSVWNTMNEAGVRRGLMQDIPATYYHKWLADRLAPKLIHYSSTEKPWRNPQSDMAYIWWNTARETQYYESIIYQNITIKNSIPHEQITKLSKYRWQLRKYRLFVLFTFGKTRIHYARKKRNLKLAIATIERKLK